MNLVSLGNQILNLDKITRVKALSTPKEDDPYFCIQVFFETSRITIKGKAAYAIWRKLHWMTSSDLSFYLDVKQPQKLNEHIVEDEAKEELQSLND
jgi:hypothetical protein